MDMSVHKSGLVECQFIICYKYLIYILHNDCMQQIFYNIKVHEDTNLPLDPNLEDSTYVRTTIEFHQHS
jgi:hypothetical protein